MLVRISPLPSIITLVFALLMVSGCSGSSTGSSPNSSEEGDNTTNENPVDINSQIPPVETDTNTPSIQNITDVVGDSTAELDDASASPIESTLTLVTFDITVPVYVSNALQVQVQWGDKQLFAAWVTDETWTASDSFPTNTEQPLSVTFLDNNGELVLASYETNLRTGEEPSQSVRINADQFQTVQWDSDEDGVSNFNESIAGTNPTGADLTEQPLASLELIPGKIFRLTWQPVSGAQFYRVLENSDGVSGFTIISENLDSATRKYDHRVALLEKINARYIVQVCNTSSCIDSIALPVPEAIDEAAVFVKASNADPGDLFGAVVSLSADGNSLAVGAPIESSASTGVNSNQDDNSLNGLGSTSVGYPGPGAVYVFERVNGQWRQEAYIKASTIGASDSFGANLELSGDGNTLVVGAEYEGLNSSLFDNGGRDIIGAAFIFRKINGSWVEEAKLKPGYLKSNDFFAMQVSVSGDGDTVTVISRYDFHYVYKRINDKWEEQANLTYEGDDFRIARSVDLNQDGNTMAMSRPGEVTVYVRSNDIWERQASVEATNRNFAGQFGDTISLSADGNTLAVSAYKDSGTGSGIILNGSEVNEQALETGAVFIFVRTDNRWAQSAYIKSDSPQYKSQFGRVIALSADATALVVSSTQGTHVYRYENENWQLVSFLESDRVPYFHSDLSFSADGSTLAGGSERHDSAATGINGFRDDTSALDAGAVFLY